MDVFTDGKRLLISPNSEEIIDCTHLLDNEVNSGRIMIDGGTTKPEEYINEHGNSVLLDYIAAKFLAERDDYEGAAIIVNRIEKARIIVESIEKYGKFADPCSNSLVQIENASYYFFVGRVYGSCEKYKKEALEAYSRHNIYQLSLKMDAVNTNQRCIYSFRTVNKYSISDLKRNTVTAVSPKRMNDPFDTLLYDWLEARKEALKTHIDEAEKLNPQILPKILQSEKIYEESLQHYLIRSLVDDKRINGKEPYQNTLMWAHYANSHKGICIKYSFSPSFRFKQSLNGYRIVQNIHYLEENEGMNLFSETEIPGEKALLTKSSDWKYENEVRLLSYSPGLKSDHMSIPLDSESSIEAVYFGTSCTCKDKQKVFTALKGQSGIKFYQMKKNYSDIYTLTANPIQ